MAKTNTSMTAHLRRHVRNRLVSGILVLIPMFLTYLILAFLFTTFSSFALPLLTPVTGDLPHSVVVVIALVGTGLAVYLIGLFTAHFIGQRLLRIGEAIILKVPVAKSIYSASKQIVDVFSAGNNAAFKAVVIIEFPHPGSLGIGFATGRISDERGRLHYNVFIPTTPNPTSGYLIMVPAEAVRFTTMSVEAGIKMIVSGGVLSPEQFSLSSPKIMEMPNRQNDE